jgi:hypothetical protein
MNLKDFVAASLQEILEGVKQAQATEEGQNINAEGAGMPAGKGAYSGGAYGTFTLVEFDVAVSVEAAGRGGANLKVFGAGFEGGGEQKKGAANRITFTVPVRLPDGDTRRARDIATRQRDQWNEAPNGWCGASRQTYLKE